ncbi:MAG: Mrp/NBP35 family ATP-binding protein [Paludibacteraceae bacterium]|nr:Mrp/NBP35 family ATP-binding protein [Paludibacteraceae bacterium]
MTLYPQLILDALAHVKYPATGQDIVSAGMVYDNIRIDGMSVSFSLLLKPNDPLAKSLVKACEQAILTYVSPETDIIGHIDIVHPQADPQPKVDAMAKVKCKIAVSSGKGGVGKSTVSANLAVALAKQGYKIGLLDADIYGPSIPKMFGIEGERPVADEQGLIVPIEKYGVKILSIGFFVDPGSAIVWRGAMASNAIKQLISEAAWGELDFFLIDLPPGTSDIHLTLVQNLQLDGAIVVSTPQAVALADAVKGIDMFRNPQVNVPILGIVENMAWFTPEELPEHKYYLFGKEGAKQLAEREGIELLGQVPLVQSICESGDQGRPIALQSDIVSAVFADMAKKSIFAEISKKR